MRYKLLGKSGLRVSELCLGAMTFGKELEWGATKNVSRRIMDTYLKAGGNFIDTANKYMEGTSEKYVGEFIASERENIVLATKYTMSMQKEAVNLCGNHRKNMIQSLEKSLRRLNTDYIDLYWVHAWDFLTPVEEVMRALDDMIRAGKILYIGISDTPAWIISHANTLAELRGWTSFVGLQIEYSLIERTPERELLPMANAFDIAVTAWAPLGGGILTGKYNQENSSKPKRMKSESPRLNKRNLSIAEEVQKIAQEIERTPAQVALNWLKQQEGLIIPIVGARKVKQIRENLGYLDFELTLEHLQKLDEVSKIELGFPHDFLKKENIRELIHGGTFDVIDNHRSKK